MFRPFISIRTSALPRPLRTIGSFQAKTIGLPLRPCAFSPISQMASSSSSSSRAWDQGQSSSFPTFKDRGPSKSPTHFLCLPLHGNYYKTLPPAHLSLKTALKQFTIDEANPESGLSESEEKFRIPPDAFRPFDTLHLTLGVMTLSTKEEVENAISTLKSLDLSQFLPPAVSGGDKKLYVDLKGLQPFSNSKSTITGCRVLFLPPTDASSSSQTRLLQFSEALRSHFLEKGILTPENRPLTLHATVINTVYCKRINPALDSRNTRNRDRGSRSNKVERVQFDASEVLERYKDHVWAAGVEIDRVQICRMGAKKGKEVVLEDGTVEVIGGGYESIVDTLIE
ncbi:hypothetical protein TWF679_008991 [Orbilia oligospora]|uniref:A-kinase anchor protein 7-like phosphoesterase domain-containing protein n=1 Tax=Orbilia oligospora TaxID=2813651 RepID=A0A8H8VK35_ORBOL|nr:hypothetical protein TWF679_008991 [Orbilia oligospora]